MTKKTLNITQLYPSEMNIYGDNGNALALKKRAELCGFAVKLRAFEPGDSPEILRESDVILGGGGQDSGQEKVLEDLQKNAEILRGLAADGAVMLVICGLYQLFGKFFRESDGTELDGIGIFNAETVAGPKRLIGNITIATEFGRLVGYENHSGLTYLRGGQAAFGRVEMGAGNNGRDGEIGWNFAALKAEFLAGKSARKGGILRDENDEKVREKHEILREKPSEKNVGGSEGARENNCFGSYLHGPILPKNAAFAQELLRLAVVRKFGDDAKISVSPELASLDRLAARAQGIAAKRPR